MEKEYKNINENASIFAKENKELLNDLINSNKIGFLNTEFSNEEVLDENTHLPVNYYTYVSPISIKTLLQPLQADKVAVNVERLGEFGTKAVAINRIEYTGDVEQSSLWGDMFDAPNVDVKYSFIKRGTYYGTLNETYNSLKGSLLAKAKIDHKGNLDEARARALALFQNKSFFFGIGSQNSEYPIYGYLNDPNVIPEFVVAGAGGSTKWADKTSLEIAQDLSSSYNTWFAQMKGKVEDVLRDGGYVQLTVGTNHYGQLTTPNIYRDGQAMSMIELIGKQLGREIKIISVPELDGNIQGEDAFIWEVISPSLNSLTRATVVEAMYLPTFIKSANTSQQVITSTAGQILRYPEFRKIMIGI